MFIVTILISLLVVAQSGWTVHAMEYTNAKSSLAAAVLPSNADSDHVDEWATHLEYLSMRSRRLQDTPAPTPDPLTPVEAIKEVAQEEAEEIIENAEEQAAEIEAEQIIETAEQQAEEIIEETMETLPTTEGEFESGVSTTSPPNEYEGELESGEWAVTTTVPPVGSQVVVGPRATDPVDPYDPYKYDEENEFVENNSPAPTAIPAGSKDDNYYANEPWGATINTPQPTVPYIPKGGDDPIEIEEQADVADFSDDGVIYHGLGGKVGEFLDGVESPQELERDRNIQIIAGILGALFLVLLLVTAHLVMHYPDGLCAGCCRLTLKCICCFTRTLCLPCRALCCKGSEQTQNRRTHAPMRTPFPSDLELA